MTEMRDFPGDASSFPTVGEDTPLGARRLDEVQLKIAEDNRALPPISRLQLFRQSTDSCKFVSFLIINVIVGAVVYIVPSGKNFHNFKGDKTNWFSDSLYYSSTILTTNGFGDLTPVSAAARVLTSIYIIFNFLVMNYAIYGLFCKFVDLIEGPNSTRTRKNGMCFLYCLTTLILGVGLLYCEGLDFGQTVYTIIVAFSSTGLGDFSFSSRTGRVFGALWMLLSHMVLSRIGYLLTYDSALPETNKTLQEKVVSLSQDLLIEKEKFNVLQNQAFHMEEKYTIVEAAYKAENKHALKMKEKYADAEAAYKAKNELVKDLEQKYIHVVKEADTANEAASSARAKAKAESSEADRIIKDCLLRIETLEISEIELRGEVDSLRSINSEVSSNFKSLEVVARNLLNAAVGSIKLATDLCSQKETNEHELELLKERCNTRGVEPGRDAEEEHAMNPWEVCTKDSGKIDYYQLIDRFGCQSLELSIPSLIESLTGRLAHIFLRRGIFLAHRDFNEIIDSYRRGEKFYLHLGLGPSSESMHLGKMIPFIFARYMQDAFKVPVVIQLTDDEKCIWNELRVEESQGVSRENAKDIIACGFDSTRTFIFSDFSYIGGAFYENMVKVAKSVTIKQVEGIFGFTGYDLIGKISFAPVKAVPSFPSSFPHLFSCKNNVRCLIPCAIDQDPFYNMVREVAPKIGYDKPALIESIFLPALQGEAGKMSANNPTTMIYVTDSSEDIKNKVNSCVFSDGDDSMENRRKDRDNIEEDILIKYLGFFHEDDADFEYIKEAYGEGKMLLGGVKARLIEVLSEFIEKHKKARAAVTDEMVDQYMTVRPLPHMFS